MRKFWETLLLSGYHSLPLEQNYWSTQPGLGEPAVYNTIRNNYVDIEKFICFATRSQMVTKLVKSHHHKKC